ncbi:MAG TPA: LysM domain-containing protein [Sphingobium sp.]|nr:LysM domain-containing protein [Sphingobium sp.]
MTKPHPLLALTVVALLSACSQSHGGGGARPATIQQIDNAQRIDDVISLLDSGDTKSARKALQEMAKHDPADQAPARLLESLSADPTALLGAKNFAYRVQPGDRMTDLSRRFLGDRLKFYALARYNGITVPSSLKAGQSLRIPGDEPPKPVASPAPAPRPVLPAPRPVEVAKPAPARPAPKAPAANPAQAARLRASGLTALNQGQVARAVVLLHQASSLAPADPLIRRDLERAERVRRTVKTKR